MNDPKKWLMLSESSWLLALALVLGIPWTHGLWPLALYIGLGYRRWPPAFMVAFLVAGLAASIAFFHLPLVMVAAVALWRGFSLSRNDFLDMRFPFVIGVLASVSEFITRPSWGWIPLLLVAAFSLMAMVPYGKRSLRDRSGFAGQLLVAGVLSGLAASALIWLMPWGKVLHGLFTVVATPLVWLLHFIPFAKLKARPQKGVSVKGRPSVPKIPHQHYQGPPHWLAPLALAMAAVAALGLAYLLWRHLRRSTAPVVVHRNDPAIIHEHIERPADWLRNPFAALPPVRSTVRRILHEAKGRGKGRVDSDTLRQWAQATHPHQNLEDSLRLYDQVRYGNFPDTREDAQHLRQSWPSWPEPDKPTLAARARRRIRRP